MKVDESIKVSIKDKKKTLEGQLLRCAIVGRSMVQEVKTTEDELYYAIFYKQALIYAGPTPYSEVGSFIKQAFKSGLVLESPHPALALTIPDQPLSPPNKKKLFSKLQDHYTFQEVSYIATTLDAFFDKEQLTAIIHKILSHLKRNGQHFKAYQVTRILASFDPEEDFAQSQLSSHEFQTYDHIYNADLPTIQKKDPFYAEEYCFEHRSQKKHRNLLIQNLEEQGRYLEAILLWLEAIEDGQEPEAVQKYTNMAEQYVSFNTWIQILSHAGINAFQTLPEKTSALMESAVSDGQAETTLSLLSPHIGELPERLKPQLQSLCNQLDPALAWKHLGELLPILETLDHETIESFISRLVTYLLQSEELLSVKEKLAPCYDILPDSPALHKLDHMIELSEDPDHMMQLGEYYVAFGQWDRAIECFYWDMEVHPEDTAPVWQLSKMYQHKGMKKEAEAYQQYFSQLQKQS